MFGTLLQKLKGSMNKGAQTIDYHNYAVFMRKALSGPQICNQDGSLNHIYFNTKKGFYWSEEHNEMLREGLINFGVDWQKIKEQTFNNSKTEVEIELRACILLGVKESSKITQKELSQLVKVSSKSGVNVDGSSQMKNKKK